MGGRTRPRLYGEVGPSIRGAGGNARSGTGPADGRPSGREDGQRSLRVRRSGAVSRAAGGSSWGLQIVRESVERGESGEVVQKTEAGQVRDTGCMMTGEREKELMSAAAMLLDARRTNRPIDDLPEAIRPRSLEEAYFIQDRLALAYGEIGGWKVGAPGAEATPMFAPMPRAWIAANYAVLGRRHRFRGLEAEIAFLMAKDLPPRQMAYS